MERREEEVAGGHLRRAGIGLLVVGLVACAQVACNREPPVLPGREGARAVLRPFLRRGADLVALTRRLKPTSADYRAVFTDAYAAMAEEKYERGWKAGRIVLRPGEGADDLLIYQATVEDLRALRGEARKFPVGYALALPGLRPGLTFYYFKFVKKGTKEGLHYDGLVFVNGRWVLMPKPWRALPLEPGPHPF